MLTDKDVRLLESTLTFWSKLTIDEKDLIINNVTPVNYHRGETIHRGDSNCIGVMLIKTGSLRIYILSDEGKEITLYRLYAGDVCMLSASCLMKNITFDVHIDSEESSQVLLVNSSVFAKLIKQNIYVENFSYKTTVDRFSDVMWAMEQILFMSFDRRMATFLIDESAKNNSNTIMLTHDQIAKYMGSAREVVSRMLKYFANEGVVEMSRGGVKIIDKVKLRSFL
ncbi:MAG: Crp/Fnr family transcriptional regulator [Oscillospiraceae bacterium]